MGVVATQFVLRHGMYSELQIGVFLGLQYVVMEVATANCTVARSVPPLIRTIQTVPRIISPRVSIDVLVSAVRYISFCNRT